MVPRTERDIEEAVVDAITTILPWGAGWNTALSLKEDLGADSLDLTELAIELEDAFCPTIEDNQVEHWETVQDVIDDMVLGLAVQRAKEANGDV